MRCSFTFGLPCRLCVQPHLPAVPYRLCSCLTSLCWLDLANNELAALPRSLTGLTSLETVSGLSTAAGRYAWHALARRAPGACQTAPAFDRVVLRSLKCKHHLPTTALPLHSWTAACRR